MFVLDVLAKLAAAAAYRVVQEYRDLEERMEVARLGIMDDGTLGPGDPHEDVYCQQVGFSAAPGRLRRGE